ncbi:MAG: hypothetical protein ACKO8O_11270 [Betaproteobacteria bacterium]
MPGTPRSSPVTPPDQMRSDPPPGTASSGFIAHQAAGIAILLWSADPAVPGRLATPFFHAAAAAAMDIPVEIYFSAASVQLLAPDVAARLTPNPDHPKTVLDSIREAVSLGAQLFACSDALVAHRLDQTTLIPECSRRGGAVQFMVRAADLRWRALVF